MNISKIIEGLLFICGDEGLRIEQLEEILEQDRSEILSALKQLIEYYELDDRGIEIVDYGGVYKFLSKDVVCEYAQKLFASTKINTLSQSALETLAIIAYKQPITRVEIEEIRGVGCENMIKKLMIKSYIKEIGRSDAPGKPFLYEITEEFMDAFKLTDLNELPKLPEFGFDEANELFSEEVEPS